MIFMVKISLKLQVTLFLSFNHHQVGRELKLSTYNSELSSNSRNAEIVSGSRFVRIWTHLLIKKAVDVRFNNRTFILFRTMLQKSLQIISRLIGDL